MNRYFDEVHSFVRTADLFDRGQSILVGFSGGPDSMFLADALRNISQTYRYGWEIRLAHLNHGLSPAGDENESFCRQIAAEYLGLELHVKKVDIPALKEKKGLRGFSAESLGRRERYRFFLELCREFGVARLATGHQLDDQAETVLMRAVGGSWLTGLGGIPVKRSLGLGLDTLVVRPLLRTSREQINEYIRAGNIPHFDDSTNRDQRYTRNRVRHKLMPMLKRDFNPAAHRHLASLGMQAQELETELQHLAAGFVRGPEERSDRTLTRVGIGKLAAQGPLSQRYILRAALLAAGMKHRDVTHRRVERVRDLLVSERRGVVVRLSELASVLLDDDDVVVTLTHETKEIESLGLSEFQICRDGSWIAELDNGPWARVTAELMSMPRGGMDELLREKPAEVEYVDADRVLFPCYVRGRRDGDRIRPLGMEGEKKLSDIFTDAKTPREEREATPVVCDASGPLWVVGHTISHPARVTERTAQVLMLTAIERTGSSEASGFLPPVE